MEKMMKTYPYIGKSKHGNNYLFTSINAAYSLINKSWMPDASQLIPMENVTREYLQNTYGEVVSPEHAEFIIELAELHGFDCGEFIAGEDVYFYAGENSIDFTSFEPIASNDGKKQITIPLPPKADKQELSEWPCVGSVVTWGNKSVKGEVKALSDGLAWIKNEYGNYCSEYVSSLQKPKTPEEELRDDILDCDNFAITESKANQLANWLTNKGYEIKKKPQ